VTLQFLTKPDKDSTPLRAGDVDVETGVIDEGTAPELRAVPLFQDRWIGVVRVGHTLTQGTDLTASYGDLGHILVLRRGLRSDEIDEAALSAGMKRKVATVVSGFSTALALACKTDLVATVPERHTGGLRDGLHSFTLPFEVMPFTISMLWHPRMDGDAAHRWLRGCIRSVCVDRPSERS
jgi:DNA-binding transcriptional LysR family regulator